MNYLAHFFLSGDDPEFLCGNFIADHVKGKSFRSYPERVQIGILLHREIDSFTDNHPIFQQSKQRLFPNYRHYSSVIVDMFYDHFLAVSWTSFSPIPLKDFANRAYELLAKRNDLPVPAEFMLQYMREQDWLSSYADFEGLKRALTGLSNRTAFESGMEKSVDDLKQDYDLYESEFHAFFPKLIKNSGEWIAGNDH